MFCGFVFKIFFSFLLSGPTLFPLAGLYPMIENDYPMKSWTKYYEQWGDVVGFVMGNNYGLLVNGWEAVKEFLNHEDCQGRPDVCLIRDRFDGDNYGKIILFKLNTDI